MVASTPSSHAINTRRHKRDAQNGLGKWVAKWAEIEREWREVEAPGPGCHMANASQSPRPSGLQKNPKKEEAK